MLKVKKYWVFSCILFIINISLFFYGVSINSLVVKIVAAFLTIVLAINFMIALDLLLDYYALENEKYDRRKM